MRVIITGTSQGIGNALAEHLLSQNISCTGIGRRHTIDHKNYNSINLDLSDIKALEQLSLPDYSEEKIVLVNNAGVLHPITYQGNTDSKSIIQHITVNVIAVQVLTNLFLKKYANKQLQIVNISSGAANGNYDGWANYCSSKAAMDRYSFVLQNEFALSNKNIPIHSVSPGIIDTQMQHQIRTSDAEDFSSKQRFVELHQQNELKPVTQIAEELMQLINNPLQYQDIICRL